MRWLRKPRHGRSRYGHLYKTARWRELRAAQLEEHPYCQCPYHADKLVPVPADIVDHRKPHRGDARLFFDPHNLQSLTKRCHDKYKQSAERGGDGFKGFDTDGNPVDRDSRWYDGGPGDISLGSRGRTSGTARRR